MVPRIAPVLLDGQWNSSLSGENFQAINPQTRESLPSVYPVSSWSDCAAALDAAEAAFLKLRQLRPTRLAGFLSRCAERIEQRAEQLVRLAHCETGLPVTPRLQDVELPRTTHQLRQAAAAAGDESWKLPTIDTRARIRSYLAPVGPVAVLGPNNFPFAFNGIAGGDFAAAIAAGNPVIAKANPGHPGTTKMLAEEVQQAAVETEMPAGTVQMIYRLAHTDGERFVSDPRLGAVAYTGSRAAGLKLKTAADAVGKPIYLELSSVNPVLILPGGLLERGGEIAQEFTQSCLMGGGQFCTNPGLVFLLAGDSTDAFLRDVASQFSEAPTETLLSPGVQTSLQHSVAVLIDAGAQRMTPDSAPDPSRCCYPNTLLSVTGEQFLSDPVTLQTEAFGNSSLVVVARDVDQAAECLTRIEGALTGCIYSHRDGQDDAAYARLEPILRQRVGRLLNDKMPTGVAVSPAMNHGGPFPATGHPHFTAVGIPAALRRFSMLHCYDNVRSERLPLVLRDKNPTGQVWRCMDGVWSQADVDAVV